MSLEDINSNQQAPTTELFDHMVEGCQIIGFDWRYRYLNDAAAAQSRYAKADLLGRRMMDIYPGIQDTPLFIMLSRCMEGRTPEKLLNEFVYPDQSRAWFELKIYPVSQGVFVMSQDISESKRAEEKLRASEARYRGLFEHMLEGFAYCKMEYENNLPVDFTYLEVNQKFEELTGLVNVTGKKVSEVIPDVQASNPELFEIYGRVAMTGSPERFESYIPSIGIWFSISVYSSEKGYFIAVFDTITERKKAEEKLRQSERLYRAIGETLDYGVWVCAPDGRNTYASESFLKLVGLTQQQCSDFGWGDVLHPDDAERTIAAWKECVRTGGTWDIEHRYRGVDGQWHPILARGVPIRDENGQITSWAGINLDISQQKQAEEDLRVSRQKTQEILESIQDGFMGLDRNWRFTYFNRRAAQNVGLQSEQAIGKNIWETFPSISGTAQEVFYRQVMDQRQPARLEIRGTLTHGWYELRAYPSTEGITVFWTDISERKQAEENLQEHARLLDLAHVLVRDMDNKVIFWNRGAEELYGWSKDEALGKETHQLFQTVFPHSREALDDNLLKYGVWEGELIHTKRDGSKLVVASHHVLHRGKDNQPVAIIEVNNDITLLKQAEEALKRAHDELEQRVQERTQELSDLYNFAPCGYHSLDSDGLIVRVNDTELSWLGYSRAEILGKIKVFDLFTPASQQTFKENFPGFLERGWVKDLLFDVVRKDGSILPILLSGTAMKDAEGRYLMSRSTMVDYSERKQAEEAIQKLNESLERRSAELERSNKELEAFAYSISHDLRAPLRAIDGFSRILLEDYQDKLDNEGKRVLNVIRANTNSMDHLISDLLALSRVSRIELHLSSIDMSALASSVYSELAQPEIQAKFVFSISDLPAAYGDQTLLRQVWSNLLSNAIKYTLPKEQPRIEVGASSKDGLNVYYVKDNGVGFNPEYTHKLFGLFQRLHGANEFEGTGVGLAIVQRILQRHGGQAWAEGKIGQGATIYFSIPVKENEDAF